MHVDVFHQITWLRGPVPLYPGVRQARSLPRAVLPQEWQLMPTGPQR